MPRYFVVDGVEVDVTDREAVQTLSSEQYSDLLRQTLTAPHDSDDVIVGLREEKRSGPIWWRRET